MRMLRDEHLSTFYPIIAHRSITIITLVKHKVQQLQIKWSYGFFFYRNQKFLIFFLKSHTCEFLQFFGLVFSEIKVEEHISLDTNSTTINFHNQRVSMFYLMTLIKKRKISILTFESPKLLSKTKNGLAGTTCVEENSKVYVKR